MRTLVTGVAGFIGSRLAARLLEQGHDVVGVDCLTPYYDTGIKRRNLDGLADRDRFAASDTDLRTGDLAGLVDTDVIFHLAGQPGVRTSWGDPFEDYLGHNLLATQRLLEAMRAAKAPPRMVFASSSSVYGDAATFPTPEDAPAQPVSPYGVTKLAAERLLDAYRVSFGIQAVALRYFTVYGPGQRPDMAIQRFILAMLAGEALHLYGDGSQVRDVTYVDDVVAATIAAAEAPAEDLTDPGALPVNVAGGSQVSINEIIEHLERVIGTSAEVLREPVVAGDVLRTGGDVGRARRLLGYEPATDVAEGLAAQVERVRA